MELKTSLSFRLKHLVGKLATFLEFRFQLRAHGTNLPRELRAGFTIFAAMAYVLAVNPSILSTTGMDQGALITVTAIVSAISTLLMALFTNYPIALAPGMGMNAFFAFTICTGMKIPWQSTLGLIFVEGVLFFILSITGVRQKIVESIPYEIKMAIACGVGLFIAFIGFQQGGVIVAHPGTLVTLGDLRNPATLLVTFGILLSAILIARRVRGALILAVLAVTFVGAFVPNATAPGTMITTLPNHFIDLPASIAPTFLAFDFSFLRDHLSTAIPLCLTLLFIDLFDALGTLIGVSQRAGLLDATGQLPGLQRALTADAASVMIGATLGTSNTTPYAESVAGVEEGGRTGLTAVATAICFLAAMFFHPLIRAIPTAATAPVLIMVGVFMMQSIAELDLRDFIKAFPAIITVMLTALAFSISEGLAVGFVLYVGLMVGVGRYREVPITAYILAALFFLHFCFR